LQTNLAEAEGLTLPSP